MTDKEAADILEIMSRADGGCEPCVTSLFFRFAKKFPEIGIHVFESVPKHTYWEPKKLAADLWEELGRKRSEEQGA